MRTLVITLALYLSATGLALPQDKTADLFALLPAKAPNAPSDCVTLPAPPPTRRIAPEDIEQDSIEFFQITPSTTTNNFVIRFRYTEAGAKKMLAFRREHAGHEVLTQIGSFERRGTFAPLERRPAGWTEEGWLKRRTDKLFGMGEDDAKKIVEGLRKK
ncbi:MAG: hypothetical protein QM813_17695 [Verrucomicrobiota bacterium]